MVSELVAQRAYATQAGTERFVQRHSHGKSADAYTKLEHLSLSSLGMGTYLGRADDAVDAAYHLAIVEAVRRGVNVIDTAANYRCQRSETVVGKALAELMASGEIFRSEVLVASKAGFVGFDGAPPADPMAYLRARTVDAGLCAEDELNAGCHCMAPAYLRATLAESRARLGLETIDVYFVHNPETQLQTIGRDLFEERLRRAFAALEASADAGHLRAYGIATWSGLRAKPHERDYLSLERVVRCAEDVAGSRHRCRAVQLPVNLAMPEAFVNKNQEVRGEPVTILQAAERLGLVVFASGILLQGKLARTRLTHVPPLPHRPDEQPSATLAALQFARSLPGVASALCGMASPAHLSENLAVLDEPRATLAWLQRAAQPPQAASYGAA